MKTIVVHFVAPFCMAWVIGDVARLIFGYIPWWGYVILIAFVYWPIKSYYEDGIEEEREDAIRSIRDDY